MRRSKTPIVCENSKPGNPPSEWDINGSGDANIQGFATDISVDQGQPVHFKVDTNSTDYRLDIYRMGYYGGDGARKMATVQPSASLPQSQPNCLRPTFRFQSEEPNSTFKCRFDSHAFAACSGPGASHTPSSQLSFGSHSFEVRATDEAKNTDPTPAKRTLTVVR